LLTGFIRIKARIITYGLLSILNKLINLCRHFSHLQLRLLLLWLGSLLLRCFSLPGFASPYLAITAVMFRLAYWEEAGPLWGDMLAGFFFWLFALFFLWQINPLVPVFAALCLSLLWLFEGTAYRILRQQMNPSMGAVLALSATQYIGFTLLFGGFPWAGWALSFIDTPLASLGPVWGENGLTVFIFLSGAALYALFKKKYTGLFSLGIILSLWLISGLIFTPFFTPPDTQQQKTLDFLALQPEFKTDNLGKQPGFKEQVRDYKILLTKTLPAYPATDLIVFPETLWPSVVVPENSPGAIRWNPDQSQAAGDWPVDYLRDLQKYTWQDLLTGANLYPAGPHPYILTGAQVLYPAQGQELSIRSNEAVLFSRDGRILVQVPKKKFVPLGEILPLPLSFPWARELAALLYRATGFSPTFTSSTTQQPMQALPEIPSLGIAICWDNFFEEVFREQVKEYNVAAFIILSNEARLRMGLEHRWVESATRWRCLETGRPILRVAHGGLTALFNQDGRFITRLPDQTRAVLPGKLPLIEHTPLTPYALWGWLLFPLLGYLTLGLLLLSLTRYFFSLKKKGFIV
jgi:apolipoprotein N-acyltransferase